MSAGRSDAPALQEIQAVMGREAVDERIRELGLVKAANERRYAAILFTYRCTISCRHCLFGCRGARPDVVMQPEKCAAYLEQLHQLGRAVHIAGGEPLMYWDALIKTLAMAGRRGATPHFVETNCSFATNGRIVRERFGKLKDMGLIGMFLSADPYHQEYVPAENFIRARDVACDLFGAENVFSADVSDDMAREHAETVRDEGRLAGYVSARPPRLVGTAQAELGRFVEPVPLDEVPSDRGWGPGRSHRHCGSEFEAGSMWEVHIDPYDNIQTNCGVILGKADRVSIVELMERGPEKANFVTMILSTEGPLGLAEFARRKHAYEVPEKARQKCELCYLTRRYLHSFYPEILGPDEIYG